MYLDRTALDIDMGNQRLYERDVEFDISRADQKTVLTWTLEVVDHKPDEFTGPRMDLETDQLIWPELIISQSPSAGCGYEEINTPQIFCRVAIVHAFKTDHSALVIATRGGHDKG